ncbi:SDR family oxidoreductase [Phycicoccus jejuensis]|uniref:SDR family oxidoreductase n=1 Tax=Phycicoccus jejuensis TaxID=367299 RepID=UPI0004C450F1|nr:SDR family oxidoreductase [Phycicoccus jejuensis]
MRILTIGGHGKVARHLTPLLAERSHEVTAVIRNPEHAADVEADGATAKVADVQSMSTPELADLVRGFDAVVWSAGAGGGDPERTYAVDRDAAIRSMDAALEAGVERYVMVSYYGAGPDHGVPEDDAFFAYADAKTAADEHLQASGLAWTLVRPSALTDDPSTGRIETSRTGAGKGSVPRADVALVIAEVLARPGTAHAVVEFNTGDTPVADELDAVSR